MNDWHVDPVKRDDRRPKIQQQTDDIDNTMGAIVVVIYDENVELEAVDFVRGRHYGHPYRRIW